MEKDFLKYCSYYKGEEKCPFEEDSDNGLFWFFEKMYWTMNVDHERWKEDALEYISNNKEIKNLMTDESYPLEKKGFIMYAEAMMNKWTPYDVDKIFLYK